MTGEHESERGHQQGGMGSRGVTRPMAEQQASAHGGASDHDDHESHDHEHNGGHDEHEHEHGGGHGHHMSREDRLQMLRMHHKHTLWIYWTLPLLGVWTLLSPFTFGHLNPELWVDVSQGERGPWWFGKDNQLGELRAWLMTASDIAAGLVLVVFGWRSLTPNRPRSLWACCGAGIWLTFAPVLFWCPTAAAYVNDTAVGAMVIALAILIPGMPNMIMYMQMGPETPPGWSYNPSSWPQRWIMILTGFAGFIVSRYLAAFQLGYITKVWDPFFGFSTGTEKVLNSNMSHMWPISDAGLGAISYTFEFLMGYMGSPARWRTMPWMVAFFGV
ncbi:MAG: vitamin K epoxide reductase, partial [Planctomycetes bacterium]|nr:vitamin K epoxide reductase [Planctomycetota bacterium]